MAILKSRAIIYSGLIFVLSCIDSILTLKIIDAGGYELNPIMDWLIAQGDTIFIVTKMTIVGIGAFILAKLHDRMLFSISVIYISFAFVLLYIDLVAYEVILLSKIGNITLYVQ